MFPLISEPMTLGASELNWSVSRRFRTFSPAPRPATQTRSSAAAGHLPRWRRDTKTAALLPADLNRLTRETDMLLATIDSLTDEEFAAPLECDWGGLAPT